MFSSLSDENRLRLLFALRHGELCVCQLIALLDLAPSTVSKHLSILRDAGLLDSRKDGRWVHYRLAKHPAFPIVACPPFFQEHQPVSHSRKRQTGRRGKNAPLFFQSLEKSARVRDDDRKLKQIRREDMDDLCRRLLRKR